MSIVFGLSPWLILPSLLLAAGLSWVLYKWRNSDAELSPVLKWTFLSLRFLSLFIVLLLLLEPLIKSLTTKVEKPLVLVLVDESESMVMANDSSEVKGGLKSALENLEDELGDDYKFEYRGFDEDLKAKADFAFRGQVTDPGQATASIAKAYAAANLGAVVMVSDGIVNRGENPVYNIDQIRAPFYTVATGDTTPRIDAAIANLNNNRTAFKGNDFPILVGIRASKLQGKSGKLDILQGGRVLASQAFQITSNAFGREFNFVLKADKAGIQQYTVVLTSFDGEITYENNKRSFYIEVLEDREKIALVYAHTHPDVGALARALEGIQNYEVDVKEAMNFNPNLANYSLVIFHQTGPVDAPQRQLFDAVKKAAKPMLLFIGPNSDWNYLNQSGFGIKLTGASGQNQVQARISETFQLFSSDALTQGELYDLPPVAVPFGDLKCSPAIVPLYYQQLDALSTVDPLLAFTQSAGARMGFFFGEGIWRWRLAEYQQKQNNQGFDGLISRSVQYLTASGNRKQLQVHAERYYEEGSNINLSAELFNEAGQFVGGQEILFDLTYNDSVKYSYAFTKGDVGYSLNLDNLPGGKYAFSARTTYGGKKLTDGGTFVIEATQLENSSLTADHNLLYQLASKSGGKMVNQKQIASLADEIRKNPVVKAVSYSSSEVSDAIRIKWICFLLVVLLGTEWYLRKRHGLN